MLNQANQGTGFYIIGTSVIKEFIGKTFQVGGKNIYEFLNVQYFLITATK